MYSHAHTHGEHTGQQYAPRDMQHQHGQQAMYTEQSKLDFIVQKVSALDSISDTLQQTNLELRRVCDTVEYLGIRQGAFDDRLSKLEMRTIDIEARSRRNNLIFYNLYERSPDETDEQCENHLIDFIKNRLGMPNADEIVFQRVHRLGRPQMRGTVNARPRAIIACFRDYKVRQLVLRNAKKLAGSNYSIQEDFPPEIRKARTELWPDFQRAKTGEQYAKIIYPAKLVVGNRVMKDMFPSWGKWVVDRSDAPISDDMQHHSQPHHSQPHHSQPRAGSPMNIPMADLVHAQSFEPRRRGMQNASMGNMGRGNGSQAPRPQGTYSFRHSRPTPSAPVASFPPATYPAPPAHTGDVYNPTAAVSFPDATHPAPNAHTGNVHYAAATGVPHMPQPGLLPPPPLQAHPSWSLPPSGWPSAWDFSLPPLASPADPKQNTHPVAPPRTSRPIRSTPTSETPNNISTPSITEGEGPAAHGDTPTNLFSAIPDSVSEAMNLTLHNS